MSKRDKDILDQLITGNIQLKDAEQLLKKETRGRKKKIQLGDYDKQIQKKTKAEKQLLILGYLIKLRHAGVPAMARRRLVANALHVSDKLVDREVTKLNKLMTDPECIFMINHDGAVLIAHKKDLATASFSSRLLLDPMDSFIRIAMPDIG